MIDYRISGDGMINMLNLAAVTNEESAGSEVNPLDMLLAFVYILIVLALIYIILLCIDKFAKKHKKPDTPSEEKADEEKTEDGAEDE